MKKRCGSNGMVFKGGCWFMLCGAESVPVNFLDSDGVMIDDDVRNSTQLDTAVFVTSRPPLSSATLHGVK